jgi:hypothetical protein
MFLLYLGSIVMEDKLAFVDGTKKRRAKALREDHMAMKESTQIRTIRVHLSGKKTLPILNKN